MEVMTGILMCRKGEQDGGCLGSYGYTRAVYGCGRAAQDYWMMHEYVWVGTEILLPEKELLKFCEWQHMIYALEGRE